MSGPATITPTRRSALHSVHEALGARWVSPSVAWPESYADQAAEISAVQQGVALGEIGPVDKLMIRGPSTAAAIAGLGASPEIGTISWVGALEAWMLGPDEALALVHVPTSGGMDMPSVAERARTAGATVIDVSSGTTVLRLLGPLARRVLEEVDPVDVSDEALHPSAIVAAPVANVRVIIGRQDRDRVPGFTLLVDRDAAEYLWTALLEVGARHGIVPVGGAAARPSRAGTGATARAP